MKPKTKRLLKEFGNFLSKEAFFSTISKTSIDTMTNDFISQREEKKMNFNLKSDYDISQFILKCEGSENVNRAVFGKYYDAYEKRKEEHLKQIKKEPSELVKEPLLYRLKEDYVSNVSRNNSIRLHLKKGQVLEFVKRLGDFSTNKNKLVFKLNHINPNFEIVLYHELVEQIEPKEEAKPCPIDLIREGKMAIENDDKLHIERCIKYCFKDLISIEKMEFVASKYYKFWHEINIPWGENETDLPTIKATELIKIIEQQSKSNG